MMNISLMGHPGSLPICFTTSLTPVPPFREAHPVGKQDTCRPPVDTRIGSPRFFSFADRKLTGLCLVGASLGGCPGEWASPIRLPLFLILCFAQSVAKENASYPGVDSTPH